MKTEYIKPFIESAQSVLNMVCGIEVTFNDISVKSSPYFASHMVIMMGITGRIKGQVFFELSLETAKRIASFMMGGIQIVELDEMSKSAISEMGNMIMGNSSIIFANQNINLDITPPFLLIGEKIEVTNKVPTIVIPFELQGIGNLTINVTAEGLI